MYKVIRYSRYRLPEVYSEHNWWIVANLIAFLAGFLDADSHVYNVEKNREA